MDTENLKEKIISQIRDSEKELTNQYKGKWIAMRVYRKFINDENLRFSTPFQIEKIRYKESSFGSPDFLKYLVINGVDSLNKKRETTVEVSKLEVYDDEYSLKLLLEFEKDEKKKRWF